MPDFFGIDTSNYTTSAAVYSSEDNTVYQAKKLLPVKEGELGLRQSDAVFHHTKQLPDMIEQLSEKLHPEDIAAVSASSRPRNREGSYMPCFLCGEGSARSFSAVMKVPFYRTSHQVGHVLAALYSAEKLCLAGEKFIAFHVSGGTTDCLLSVPDEDEVIKLSDICTTLDLNAGQAVDRVGLMLGLKFPCGIELEKLAARADRHFKVRAVQREGGFCFSGIENQCRKMLKDGERPENIAAYCLDFIAESVCSMASYAREVCGELPLVFAGGVMSDVLIRDRILGRFPGAGFASPQFSCDNAAGVAIFGSLKHKRY
ncbi:MAG: peptidase M22 [Ruminococcus sp.]|nr:peptidase M22 [Ruminococcus sp.]